MIDRAPAIAALALDGTMAAMPCGALVAAIRRDAPDVTREELARGLMIALELVRGELAELEADPGRMPSHPPETFRRAPPFRARRGSR